jgi:hypothetical protein
MLMFVPVSNQAFECAAFLLTPGYCHRHDDAREWFCDRLLQSARA